MAEKTPNEAEPILQMPDAQVLQDMAKDGLKHAREFAKENPVLVVAASFGLGVLIGAWLKRD